MSAYADPLLVDRVRTLVRDRGTDPLADPGAVRSAVLDVLDEVVREHGAAADLDAEAWARDLLDAVAGYGPLQRLFDDPEVEEVWWNEPNRVFCARRGRSELSTVVLTEAQARDVVERMLRTSGRRVDLSQPFVDALLPDGSRLHVVIPDVTRRHWAVNVRRHVLPATRLDDLVGIGTLTTAAARFLSAAVVAGLNIVVAGGTQAGKTTLLSCLLNAVPAHERVVTCEEVFEVRLDRPDWVAMQTRQSGLEGTGEISLRRLVVEALRMRPHRLVVGEVRQAEALDLLVALNSGMPGMTSVHANSARDAVTKLCVLPMLAGENVTAAYVVPTVASAVDLVVHASTGPDGRRRVREVVAVSGRVESGVIETTDVFTTRGGELVRAGGFPPHEERFAAHGLDLRRVLGEDR
ncbi:MAG: CpaF family protein [Frankiales bacterium]|nr:CpaF family protein [Frankiales bacterium]